MLHSPRFTGQLLTIISVYLPLITQSNPSSLHTEFWFEVSSLLTSQTFAIITDRWSAWTLLMPQVLLCANLDTPRSILFFRQLMWNIAALTWLRLPAWCKNCKLLFPDLMGELLKLSAFQFKSKNWNDFKDIYLKWNQRWKTFELFSIAQFRVCVHGRLWGLEITNSFWNTI